MRKLSVFDSVSLDGFFTDAAGDMSWAHRQDEEWNSFTAGNASGGDGALLFGRVTYEMMRGFWTTDQAARMMPEVAAGMNRMPKYVVSRTLAASDWQHTTVLQGDAVDSVQALKATPGPDLVVLGSGSVVSALTQARLVDAYQLALIPVVLGKGRTLFETVGDPRRFALTATRSFRNGNVVLWYDPA
jgi:dihydrofolate reductase